ncbi:glycosyltransferase family 2 protein [Winogradskyella alexanderae]|uniref:Glycosyltransferase family 2 protein n=1 Tax=Winogradskyella alexanderae TaxID=2877123 RepID=A0ABS7XQZ7_9FLAO|nr:glycosyltransferase family 2 protein [Winogradskyella alexanderae]MCA0132439.1 glycosyltransferase family 2 protein [Winogradskyella alexanderae]
MVRISVTVVVPVKNEAKNLPACLDKLKPFSEVIVVDSNSTDSTSRIVKDYNYKLVNFNWDGKFPKKRNWVLQNVTLKNDWILFLDADEYVTPEFISEVRNAITRPSYTGFWLCYDNFFMGKQIKYGDKMRKLALFKKNSGAYEYIEEDSWSHLDMEVHEHPIIDGKVGKLKNPIIHKDYKGLEHYIQRHNAYSSWEANRFKQLNKKGFKGLTKRQKLKYKLMQWGVLPLFYFIGTYILKLGFLDGKQGYYLAKYKAYYFFQIQTKIKELGH